MPMPILRRGLVSAAAILLAVAAAGAQDRAREVVVTGTLEAATGQPMVHLRVSDRGRVLTAKPDELRKLLGDDAVMRSLPAYLDTGASGYVISSETAARSTMRSRCSPSPALVWSSRATE